MGKKILVAVGECVYSEEAVRYVAKISSTAEGVTYTLLNVQPSMPQIFIEKAKEDSGVKAEVDTLIRKDAKAARRVVEGFKDLMVREGIPEKRVDVVTQPMQEGIAKDILNQAEQGLYDAILLARRGLTPSRDFFIGTIAGKVVEHALKIPVWIAAGEAISMKFMLAVDGSKNSLRLVDHLMQIVGPHPDLLVTLFHVPPRLSHYYSVDFEKEHPRLRKVLQQEDDLRMERFYEKAHERLETAGLKKSQIESKTSTQGYDVSTGILSEARTGHYGTVVVGRRGESNAFFTGRIATRLVQKITDQALWVVP